MSVLVVGTLAFDSVTTPLGQRESLLGGSGSFLATAAAYFADVHLAGVVGEDFDQKHFDFFLSRKITVNNVQRVPGKTFSWRGRYANDFNDVQTLATDLNVLKDFSPHLDDASAGAGFVVLGNFDPKLQLQVLEQVRKPKFVALDTMNFWIERHNEALRAVLRRVDLLSVNEAEARQLSGEHNLLQAARAIQAMGPKNVVIKRGSCGALLFDSEGTFAAPAFLIDQVCDPTGAGDSFAGTMAGYLARRDETSSSALRHAVAVATVIASFVVEDFSLDRLRTLDIEQIRSRMAAYHALTHLDHATLTQSLG
jgi:sugar/nucleoside kinase (ribokinase family)